MIVVFVVLLLGRCRRPHILVITELVVGTAPVIWLLRRVGIAAGGRGAVAVGEGV